jgi:hypothetical protein
MSSYLVDDTNAAARAYALSAASDNIVTYSVSGVSSSIVSNWIERIYEYLARQLSIAFLKVESGAEFNVALVESSNTSLSYSDYLVDEAGSIVWTSVHNTQQYGGVIDQRRLVKAIGNSLGLARINPGWYSAGNSGDYTTSDTIMSEAPWDRGFDWGHTVFYTNDDINALRQIYSIPILDLHAGDVVTHAQRIKEDLLIGVDGQIDIFKLTAKGMNAGNQDAVTYDPVTGWYTVNDYNIPTIANFNPQEGDRILIERRLYLPTNPINPNSPLPETVVASDGAGYSVGQYLKAVSIDFVSCQTPGEEQSSILSSRNTLFNDAGKLMLNINGSQPGHGPGPVTGNGQLLAFIDFSGDFPPTFQAQWLGLWGQEDLITGASINVSISTGNAIPRRISLSSTSAIASGAKGVADRFVFQANSVGIEPFRISAFDPSEDCVEIPSMISASASRKSLFSIKTVAIPEGSLSKSEQKALKKEQKAASKSLKRLGRTGDGFAYNQFSGELFLDVNGLKKGFGEGGGLIAIFEGNPSFGLDNLSIG